MEDSDDDFDIIQPTLIKQLRKILDQYPDDGQILKELIQNAEDAGASNVKFLCDYHRYGTEKLHHPELGKFQGPALYAYNNERFTAEDWKGIRTLCDSIKENDPMKVGRFGLGFKSVFHMTDLPSIVSDKQVGILDPHQQYFTNRTGHRWRFKQDREKMDQIPDQFAPYKDIVGFGAESFSSRCDGTLFRFPLREKPSMLSDNLYSPKKVLDLLECFQVDAHMVLLFLKNIESIELYVRGNKECSPRKTFEVKIADESIQNVRAKRKEFIDAVRHLKHGEVPSSPVSVTYPISIECTSYEGHECTVRHPYKYLVTNYFSGGQMGADVKTLLESEDLSYLPWVGVAMAVEHAKTTVDRKGHLFCFLPLPVQKNSLTGLPVHVNGFFALSQNRRHLKWPTADQEEGGKELTDKALQWNKFLVRDVVPRAYADLLLQSKKEVPVEDFYKSWPDPKKTDPKWQEMLPLLFERLLKCATFHTTVNGGMWLKINEAIFDTLEEDSQTRKVLLNALKAANTRIVSAPRYVIDVIKTHHVITVIAPGLVRSVLRQTHSCYKNSERSEKLLLLKYILKDSRFDDLYDLELLPLSNGQFTRFVRGGQSLCEPIYISSVEHAQSLLPGLDHLFLDSNIEESVAMQLKAVATRGHPQLKHLDQNAIIRLLSRSFPHDWSSGDQVTWYPGNINKGHPSKEWLDSVWRYLSKYFPQNLSVLQNQPLIPISRSEEKVTLARLRSPSVLVLQSTQLGRLDVTVAKVLKSLGITIISELPWSVMSHPAILENYVHSPSVSSVLQAMMTLSSAFGFEVIVDRLQRQSPSDKRALRDFLAKAPPLNPKERELVQHLPLFETLEGSGFRASRFVAFRNICKSAPRKALPVRVSQELIDISQGDSKALASLSGVKMLKTTELLNQIVFQDVTEGNYSGSDIDKLMEHVFSHFSEYVKEMPEFQNIVKNLRFVPKRGGERVKPSDLFDPTVPFLQTILAGEDVFPNGPVYNKRGVMLSQLGLKDENSLTARDVLKSARHTEKVLPAENAWRKSRALLEHLNSNIHMLLGTVDGQTLGNWLKGLPWVHTMTAGPPPSYPRSLPFCSLGDGVLMKPTQITSSTFVDIIGSVKSVVGIGSDSLQSIASFFGWTKEPDIGEVIAHLKKVVDCYTQTEKPTYMIIVKKIYQHLLDVHPNQLRTALLELGGLKWVWNGDGFSSPSTVVFVKPFTDLSPYVCLLPSEVVEFKDVFKAGGTRDEGERSLLLRVLQLMKEKYDQGQNHKRDVKRDLQLSIDILNELKSSSGDCLESDVKECILIPTNGTDDSTLRLAPIEECTYCDVEWLKQGHDTSDVDEDGYTRIMYVHRNIPNDTAEILGVPSLMSRMLDAEELELGEEFGQEEPLTRSINRLLEGYTDGFAVPKELIQNADDAGATEVKFLYDERTNEDSMTCLFDKGMKACQGPALWAYNNAVFTDEDFTNITKLNGATKERDTEKIGRFGSGFNAVYNLTDVPSFISRNSFAIFDPHKTHLGKAIKNGKPGIRINLKKNRQKLRTLSNQFKPFNGMFGCDLRPEAGQDSYDGTLFRFPLRTKEQAVKSELKNLYYSDQEMRELLNKLLEGAESLLLFTQTVCRVSVFHLPRSSCGTPQPVKLFEVTKSLARVIREVSVSFPLPPTVEMLNHQEQYFAKQSSFLRATAHALRTNCSADFPRSSMVIDVEMKHTEEGSNFFRLKGAEHNSFSWLVSSTMGTASALEFVKKDKTVLPTAGIAICLLREETGLLIPKPIVEPKNNNNNLRHFGKVFCYLPLPLHSGISVHVNGFFAVASNRRSLMERTEDDKYRFGDDWNEVLMKDAVAEAFISALEDLKLSPFIYQGSCDIYELWPRADQVLSVCQPLVKSFYSRLSAKGPNSPSLFSDGSKWASIDKVFFLDPFLRSQHKIGDIAFQVFKALVPDTKMVVDLPIDIRESFRRCGCEDAITKRTLSMELFYSNVFLPNINRILSVPRDLLVLYAIDEDKVRALLQEVPCIPASPEGKKLKRPRELVHPRGDASSLYSPEDEMFPHGTKETFLSPARLERLTEELGMRKDDISWTEVVERAQSVQTLNQTDHEGALKRSRALIKYLNKKLTTKQLLPPGFRKALVEVAFLPILSKPNKFPLSWKGDVYGPHALLPPKAVFQKKDKNLVSCSRPILNDCPDGCGHITGRVEAVLGFQDKTVCLKDVMAQLETAIASDVKLQNIDNFDAMRELLHAVYKYLEKHLDQKKEQIKTFLAGKMFILGKSNLLLANQVAFKFHPECSPYLYQLPSDLASKFGKLMSEAGVRQAFDVKDYQRTLLLLNEKFRDNNLDDESVKLTVHLASLIDSCGNGEKLSLTTDIYLPDTCGRLYPSSELCIKDCFWMPDEEGVKYAYAMIPPQTCVNLGVKTRRQETLRNCSKGIPFGQHEKLTTRIKHILTAYPCEKELLKELLQNADDAQATELCFIKDPRHHGEERVFEDRWKPLQGPALCVFNNKPFTNADIAGIQNLGEGSKSDDPNKTGQYGVGFNAVYHLTDAPSFMSKGSEIGEVLCVFDPQCKFVDGATLQEPGRMFTNIDRLRGTFTDIFPCYLGDHFPVENSTMFRFPLRTKKMAEESYLCKTPVTVEDLKDMMNKFESDIFDKLLFVNYVRKITLCEVTGNGELVNRYEVTATLSEEDASKRTTFANYVTSVGTQLREKSFSLSNVRMKEVSYVVDLKDNRNCQEKWLVVQRIGFEAGMDVPDSLQNAFRAGDLALLPRGGVASLLEQSPSSRQANKPKKAFCFLPLPFQTGLPVHVNGHFALDHEARRHLWRDEAGGHRSQWNNTLLGQVVAPCYVTLLTTIRTFLHLQLEPDGVTLLRCEKTYAQERIAKYLCLFPSLQLNDPYWVTLSKEVYRYMDEHSVRLLPILRNGSDQPMKGEGTRDLEITWLPPSGEGESKAYFNNLNLNDPAGSAFSYLGSAQEPESERLKSILLDARFNLVEAPLGLYENFHDSGVSVTLISPYAVLTFFKSYSTCQSLCRLPNLPQSVKDTPVKDVYSVRMLLNYCKKEKSFDESLQGLPLLVTQDEVLRVFDSSSPSFLSGHMEVLPPCGSEFVHRCLFNSVFHGVDPKEHNTFKVFDVNAMAIRLHHALPASEFYKVNCYVQWNPLEKLETLSMSWISQVWKFLYSETKGVLEDTKLTTPEKRAQVAEKLRPLNDWCLLPAFLRPTALTHYLVPIHMADTVIDFPVENLMSHAVSEALRMLSLPELNCRVIDRNPELARMLVASLDKPSHVLQSLLRKLGLSSLEGVAPLKECETILQYFSDHSSSLKLEDATILKMLPFYHSVNGELVTLTGRRAYILQESILENGMDVWQRKVESVFLKRSFVLNKLHAFLDCKSLSEIDFYCEFVFQHFDDMEAADRFAHLDRIRRRILLYAEESNKVRLLSCLRKLRFLPAEDESLQMANHFFDPREPVYKAMLPTSMFPPAPFCQLDWLSFLREIGLVHEVSAGQFENFAKQVAGEARDKANDGTQAKSHVLLNHLFQRPNVATEFPLEQVRQIPFIRAYKVTDSLCRVQQQFGRRQNGTQPYICFEGAVAEDQKHIAWTSANLLPRTADPRMHHLQVQNNYPGNHRLKGRSNYCTEIARRLGILKEPTTEQVISHCEKVCRHWAVENDDCGVLKDTTMKCIYGFLQNHRTDEATLKLRNIPFVLVEDSKRLVLPRQIVIDLVSDQEIRPYLFKVPFKFGHFKELFLLLGSTPVVTVDQYVAVLMAIYQESGGEKLEPNEIKKSFKAVKGLFEKLEEVPSVRIQADALFLPGTKKDGSSRVFMQSSIKLVFDNAPQFRDRIQGLDEMFLVDLKQCCLKAINFEVLVKMLSEEFRPRMLTSLVQERLSGSCGYLQLQGKAEELRQLLTSQQFTRAIVRLIRHANKAVRMTDEGIASVQKNLNGIRLHGIEVLETHLLYQGKVIPESTMRKPCFAETSTESGEQVWNIYLEVSGHERTWISQVAKIVNEITDGLLKDTLVYLPELLTCTPFQIWPYLDAQAIIEDGTCDFNQILYLPQPGTFIHIEDHHLLKDELEDFEPGEFVGYELNDPSLVNEDDTPTYIYALIIGEVQLEGVQTVSVLRKRYKINIGYDKDPIEVDAVDLYKFRRVRGAPGWEMVPYEGDETAPVGSASRAQPENLEDAMDEITELLEEAWKLPDEKRDKIIKRLYLTWHPDKNPGNEEFCTEVFQYLQEEIQRIERGEPRKPRGTSTPGFNHDYFHSGFGSFFRNWNNRAQTHRRQYNHSGSSGFGFHRANPQPSEARRWLRQAKADLEAASNDLDGTKPSYEWVCFKCHQAAEKALKAAQYSKDADKTNDHNLRLNASGLGNAELSNLASSLESLLGGSAHMRYPDRTRFPDIPHDVYGRQTAIQAQDYADRILVEAKRFIDSRI